VSENEIIERLHGLLDGRIAVPGVHPVEVDVVRLQTAQGLLERSDDGLAAGAAGVGIAGVERGHELGGEHHAVAHARVGAEPIAEDLLGVALGVDVRGVDEVAPELAIAFEHGRRLRDTRAPAPLLTERHGSQTQRTDAQSGTAHRDEVVERHG
jgi:hypothetical protein